MRKSAVFVILTVLALFVTMSCQIGLGQAVDTQPPTVEFTSPAIDSKIRGSFGVSGTYSDDGIITAVIVRLESTDGRGVKYDYPGTVDVINGTWKAVVNPNEEGKLLTDGSYQATVYMSDMGGHITTQSRTFSVDNTAPVVVLQRPASKASDSPDSYGQTFTLTGQAADDSDISLIELRIYSDPEKQNLIHTVNLTNVPPTISLDAARFEEGVENDYSKIYGSTGKNGTKDFYCSIAAYDGTQRYPADGSDQTEEDKKGNCTNTYYLYEEISTSVLSNYKITELYHMFSGVFKNSTQEKSAEEIVNGVNKSLEGKQIDVGHFSLNPANNPYFTVSGHDQLKRDGNDFSDTNTSHNISNGSTAIIEVSTGLDSIPLAADSLRVYGIECDARGNILPGAARIYPASSTKTKAGTSYKFVTTLTHSDGFDYTHTYLFGVEGHDEAENSIVASGNGYGFKFISSGVAPELSVETRINDELISDNILYVPNKNPENEAVDSAIKVSGTVKNEEGQPIFRIRLDGNDLGNVTLTPTANSEVFSFERIISTDEFANKGTSAQHDIQVWASNGVPASVSKTVMYDCEGPGITIASVSPIASKYTDEDGTTDGKKYLNGKNVKVKIQVVDDYDTVDVSTGANGKAPSIRFKQNGVEVPSLTITDITTPANYTTAGIDTTKLNDGDVTIEVTAYDRSGNKTVYSEDYKVLQSTDNPVILPNAPASVTTANTYAEVTSSDSSRKNVFTASGKLLLKLIDDDGIKSYQLYYASASNANPAKPGTPAKEEASLANTPTEYLLDYDLTSQPGNYAFWLDVSDGNNTTSKKFFVQITAPAPTVTGSFDQYVTTSAVSDTIEPVDKLAVTLTIDSTEGPFTVTRADATTSDPTSSSTKIQNSAGAVIQSVPQGAGTTTTVVDYFVPTASITGSYKVKYFVTDKNNHTGTFVANYKIDNEKPKVEITSAKPTIRDLTASFRGSATDTASGVRKVQVSFESDHSDVKEATGSSGWYFDADFGNGVGGLNLDEGPNTFYVRAIDAVGNVGNWESQTFTYDKADPEISVKLDGTDYTQTTEKDMNGGYEFKFKVSDTYEIDESKTKVTIKKDGTEIPSSNITISSADADKYKKVTVVADSAGDGTYEYKIDAEDLAGKTVSTTRKIKLDTTGPVITVSTPNFEEWQISDSVGVYGTASDASGIAKVYYKYDSTGTATAPAIPDSGKGSGKADTAASWTEKGWTAASGATNWNFALSDVPEGDKAKVYMAAVDIHGNASVARVEKTIKVDKAVPVLTVTESTVLSYMPQSGFTITGTASDTNALAASGALVVKQVFTPEGGSAQSPVTKEITAANGLKNYNWSVAVPFNASGAQVQTTNDGTYTYTFELKDAAGKYNSNRTVEYSSTVDKTPPALTVTRPSGKTGKSAVNEANYLFEGNITEATGRMSGVYYKILKTTDAVPAVPAGNKVLAETWTDAGWTSGNAGSSKWDFYQAFKAGNAADGTAGLEEGLNYKVYVYGVDGAGNVSTAATAVFDVDMAAPEQATDITEGTDCVYSNSIYYFNANGLSGNILSDDSNKAAQVVNTYKIGNGTSTALGDSNDKWSIAADKFTTETTVQLQIVTTDAVGKTASSSYYVQKDITAPSLTITNPGVYVADAVTLTGSVTDLGVGVAKVQWSTAQNGTYADAVIGANGNTWTKALSAADLGSEGRKTYWFKAVDKLGNESTAQKVEFVYDTADPTLTPTDSFSAADTNYVKGDFTLKGTAADTDELSRVEIVQNNGSPVTAGSFDDPTNKGITWSKTYKLGNNSGELADGTYTFKITAYDIAQRTSSVITKTFVTDKTPPAAAITQLPGANDTLVSSATILGTASDSTSQVKDVYLTISRPTSDGQSTVTKTVKVNGTTNWSYKLTYKDNTKNDDQDGNATSWKEVFDVEGVKTVTVRAVDYAGNEYTSAPQTFIYDTGKPELTVDTSTVLKYMPSTGFTINGTAKDTYKLAATNALKVTQNDGTNEYSTYITSVNGKTGLQNWSVHVPFGNNGASLSPVDGKTYQYTFELTDAAEHTNDNASTIYKTTVDMTDPSLTITAPTSKLLTDAISDKNYQFKGTFNEEHLSGIYYQILDRSAAVPSVPAGSAVAASTWTGAGWSAVITSASSGTSEPWNFSQLFKNKGAGAGVDGKEEGNYTIYVYAVDEAGNISDSNAATGKQPYSEKFDVDIAAPVIGTKAGATVLTSETVETQTAKADFKFTITETHGLAAASPVTLVVKLDDTPLTYSTDYKVYYNPTGVAEIEFNVASDTWATETEYSVRLTAATPADGLYSYEIKAKDVADKETAVTRNVRLDKTGPVLTFESPSFTTQAGSSVSAWQTSSSINIIGTAKDVSGVDSVYWSEKATVPSVPSNGDSAKLAATWTGKDSSWTKLEGTSNWGIELSNVADTTTKKIHVASVDSKGNVSEIYTKVIQKDGTAPVLTETKITSSGITLKAGDSSITLEGKLSDVTSGLEKLSITDDLNSTSRWEIDLANAITPADSNGSYWDPANGDWKQTIVLGNADNKLKDGKHVLTIFATDNAKNSTVEKRSVIVDTKVPVTGDISVTYINSDDSTKDYDYKDSSGHKWYKNSSVPIKIASVNDVDQHSYNSGIAAVEYAVNASSINDNTATWISMTKKGTANADASYDYTATVNCTQQGKNTIYVRVKDVAGNLAAAKNIDVYIDTMAPAVPTIEKIYIDSEEVTGSKFTNILNGTENFKLNGRKKIKFVLSGSDEGTGVVSMNLTKIGSTTVSVTGTYDSTTEKWTVEIPAADIKTGAPVFEAKDKVNLSAVLFSDISIVLDNVLPESTKITLPASAVTGSADVNVNKTFSISGTASDNQEIESVDISYYINAATPSGKNPGDEGYFPGKQWVHYESIAAANLTSWALNNIDSTNKTAASGPLFGNVPDGTEVYFVPVILDTFGNCNLDTGSGTTAAVHHTVSNGKTVPALTATEIAAYKAAKSQNLATVVINQDSDRPEIRISNLNCTGMTSSNSVWHKQENLFGTVSDDDGEVTSVKISLDNGANWSNELYSSGVWEYSIAQTHNGAQKILFRIADASGTVFISGTGLTNTYSGTAYTAPKVMDNQSTANKFGYKGGTADSTVYAKLDTLNPSIPKAVWTTDASKVSAITADSGAEAVLNAAVLPAGWNNLDSLSSEYLGGTEKQKLYVLYSAHDDNGISAHDDTDDTKDTFPVEGIKYTNESGTEASLDASAITLKYPASFTGTTDNTLCYRIVEFDLSSLPTGSTGKLSIKVYDNAGRSFTREQSVTVDNTAPEITVRSHNSGEDVYGSLKVAVNGRFSDADVKTVSSLWFAVSKTGTRPAAAAFTEITNLGQLSWSIEFDGETSATSFHTDLFNTYLDSLYGAGTASAGSPEAVYLWLYGIDSLGNSGYAGLTASDAVQLQVIPKPDTPSVTIDYPVTGSTVGGTIRLSGTTTIQADSVAGVWVQIDPNYNGTTFNPSWAGALQTLVGTQQVGYSVVTGSGENTTAENPGTALGAGIKVNGTVQSWNLTINTLGEFGKIGNNNRVLAVKVYAVSNTNHNLSQPQTITFTVDPDRPVFGQDLILVNKADSTKTMKYTKGMWVSGEWWLTGSISHGAGIKTLTMTGQASPLILNGADNGVSGVVLTQRNDAMNAGATAKNWNFKIPVGAASGIGVSDFTLTATDNGQAQNNELEITVKYDNAAPVWNSVKTISPLSEAGNNVYKQSDGKFTLSGSISEGGNESGLERIAFYFTRTIGTDTYFIDPMITKDTGSGTAPARYRNNYVKIDTNLVSEDGLYWRKVTGAKIDSGVITNLTVPANVRTGGICKINGVVYRIRKAETAKITLDSQPEDSASAEVKFALAQIIDNMVTETGTTGVYNPAVDDPMSNGDGDQMLEGISQSGTEYSWNASIDSKNIYDGNTELHFVYYDAAGNHAAKVYAGRIYNNPPRIASVTVGTDFDGNGTISASEKRTKYVSEKTINGVNRARELSSDFVVSSDGTRSGNAFMTLKDKSCFEVEVIGGNGKLYYSYDIAYPAGKGSDGTTDIPAGKIKGNNETSIGDGIQDNDDYEEQVAGETVIKTDTGASRPHIKTINVSKDDFTKYLGVDGKYIPNSEVNNPTWFNYTIWDETDGMTKFAASGNPYNAAIHVAAAVQVHDHVKPNVVVNKFYWKDKSHNSLYGNSPVNGHIELEADWENAPGYTDDTLNLDASLRDLDPKVSGKITLTGYVWDNIRVQEIWLNADGFTLTNSLTGSSPDTTDRSTFKKVASFDGTTWSTGTAAITDGWKFEIDTDNEANYLGEEGHKVYWKLHLDTAKVSGGAKADVNVSLMAVDASSNLSDKDKQTYAGKVGDPAQNTPTYKMDIVPYVLKVETGLSKQKKSNWSVYNRSALGHYPVQSVIQKADDTKSGTKNRKKTSEDVILHGFNLNGNTVVINGKDGNPITVTKTDATANAMEQLKFNVANLASGRLNVLINGLAIINNVNDNDAMGGADEAGDANENKYNMQGNRDTNNILNDDIIFDVWEFNDRAAVPINGLATGVQMQVNQSSKMMNFAFANGGLYYSMGDSTYSSRYWAGDWDTFAGPCTGLGVDSLGYTYSVDSGGDTNNSGHVDKYAFFTSRWGRGSRTTAGTYGGENALRLEEIAIKTGNTTYDYALMKYRYLSSEFATSVNNQSTNVYLVNYDALTDEIRFRAGTFSKNEKEGPQGFVDTYKSNTPVTYATDNCQVIANSNEGGTFGSVTVEGISNRGAGQYVDVGVATNGTDNKDVACVVWFDAYENCLKYSYAVDPIGNWNKDGTTTENRHKGNRTAWGWSPPTTIFAEGGEYCQIAVDANNHIHIAAYAGNGDVKYAYLESYNSSYSEDANSCTVDASGAVGEHLTLDVALDGTGATANSIPYIGYFTAAIKAPKYAYLVDTTHANKVPAGVDDDERFTGAWEVTVVPTPSRPTINREDKINIGVFKTTEGVLNWSTTDGNAPGESNIGTNVAESSINGYSSTETSKAYGNGSKNAVFAYQISGASGSCIETAQMR